MSLSQEKLYVGFGDDVGAGDSVGAVVGETTTTVGFEGGGAAGFDGDGAEALPLGGREREALPHLVRTTDPVSTSPIR